MEEMMQDIEERLARHEHRLTPQREAVVRILIYHSGSHPTAEELFLRCKERVPDIGLATVYRTLELLEKLNVVHRLDSGDGQSRYELNYQRDEHYHHHLICLSCGRVSEFTDDLLGNIERKVEKASGFVVSDHCLRFFGCCQECAARKANEES